MKLISVNIENNLHDELVLSFLKKETPNVICIQELLEEKFDFYQKQLGFPGIYQLLNYEMLGNNAELIGKKQGVAIFAKNIINWSSHFFFGKEENLSKPFEEFAADKDLWNNAAVLWADVKDEGGAVYRFITTHLPVTKEGASTPLQLYVVDSLLATLENLGEFVLCGDMNAPRGNESFSRLAKKYKDNIPPEYKTSIDQNLHRAKGIQFMVDGLFTTPAYKAKEVKLADGVSDHMAVVANISL